MAETKQASFHGNLFSIIRAVLTIKLSSSLRMEVSLASNILSSATSILSRNLTFCEWAQQTKFLLK